MKTPKGLRISQVRPGTGAIATKGKIALIHYDRYLPRGDKCDSSRDRPYPVQLRVGERLTYPAIAYTVPGMAVGEIRRVKVSPNLTYYEAKHNPKLPPNVALRYEIELLRVSDTWDNAIYQAAFDPGSTAQTNNGLTTAPRPLTAHRGCQSAAEGDR